jgi:folate-binding protein YgfZ
VQALVVHNAQWNGWCSPKGRLLATFLLLRLPDGYRIVLPAEIAEPIAKRLRMFVLRSKVKIEDVTATHALLGIAGREARAKVATRFGDAPAPMRSLAHEGVIVVALEDDRFVVVAPADGASVTRDLLVQQGARPVGADTWAWLEVKAGIPIVVAATQDAFVPQMANFDLVGGVSFKKGCYPGQEIVARTQYRGILKKRMALVHGAGDPPAPGDSVYGETFGDQSAGTVVAAAASPGGGFDALVVAQIEDLDKRVLRLGSPTGTALEIRTSPVARPAA